MAEEEELEEIRRRKMQQMAQEQGRAVEEEERRRQVEEAKKNILRQVLTSEARERLNNIKMAKPEFAEQLENQLITLLQNGRIRGVINDTQLKDILKQIIPKKREITIKRI